MFERITRILNTVCRRDFAQIGLPTVLLLQLLIQIMLLDYQLLALLLALLETIHRVFLGQARRLGRQVSVFVLEPLVLALYLLNHLLSLLKTQVKIIVFQCRLRRVNLVSRKRRLAD